MEIDNGNQIGGEASPLHSYNSQPITLVSPDHEFDTPPTDMRMFESKMKRMRVLQMSPKTVKTIMKSSQDSLQSQQGRDERLCIRENAFRPDDEILTSQKSKMMSGMEVDYLEEGQGVPQSAMK